MTNYNIVLHKKVSTGIVIKSRVYEKRYTETVGR